MKKQTRKALCLVLSLALLIGSVTTTKWLQNAEAAETAQKNIVNVAAKETGSDAAALTKTLENAKAQQALLARKIYEVNFAGGSYIPDIMDTDSIYSAYALVKSGFQADNFYTAIADKLTTQLKELKESGSTASTATDAAVTTDYYEGNPYVTINYTKIALFLSATGRDISNIGGVNLIEKITDRDLYNISNPYTISRDSMILLAMNEAEAKWPDSENALTVRELIDTILADVDNQIETSIAWDSYDSAAMIIQALAPYANATETNHIIQAEILAARDKVLTLLSDIQDDSGAYTSYGTSSPWTLAQVMVTLGAYGIDPLTDQRFIKNGKTLYDISASFIDVEKETVDEQLIGGEWAYQPDQLLRGLTAALRVSTAQNPTATPSSTPVNTPTVKPGASPSAKPAATPNRNICGTITHLDKPVIKKVSSPKKKSLTVTFSKVTNAKKYVIQVSTDKKFKKKVRSKYVSSAKKVTFQKLQSRQKYYVRVQAIRQHLESKWSKTKSKKVK